MRSLFWKAKTRADSSDIEDSSPLRLTKERRKELMQFERLAGISFHRLELLNMAFMHRSYANEHSSMGVNNERLEFLGDAVLGLSIVEYLYNHLPDKVEGELAKVKAVVVSEGCLESIAHQLKVENLILIGKGEEYSGGRTKRALLADAMEAVIGAYFLDAGFDKGRTFVTRLFAPHIETVLQNKHERDWKSLLQEYVQKIYKICPNYMVIKMAGPDHDRRFWVDVIVNERRYGPGAGKSRKEAERMAAEIAYQELHKPRE